MSYYYAASGSSVAAFSPLGADFDGSNDWGSRGADLTGAADGKVGILSCWFWFDATAADMIIFAANTESPVLKWDDGDDRVELTIENTSGTQRLIFHAGTSISTGVWHHILCSWNVASAGTGRVYLDDAAGTVALYTDNTLDYTGANWGVGALPAGSGKLNGRLGELYFQQGEYLDFDTESERRKFISAGGEPVDLGANGSTPTGSQPLVYCSYRSGQSANDFLTNRGTGGGFTVNGALADGGAISL